MGSKRRSNTPEAKRMRRRRAVARAALIKKLGGCCKKCGTTLGKLEPHHTEPRTWNSRDIWSTTRLRLYHAEAEQGKLQLLCRGCNAAHPAVPVGENGDDF